MQREPSKVKILIFDDHDSVRESYIRWLEFEGFQVVGGEKSLQNCIDLLKKQRPDIVLLDIDYPAEEFAGIKAAKKISSELPGIKTIFTSHYSEPGVIAQALASGARGYFAKSDELKFLREVIEKASDGLVGLSPTATKKLIEAVQKKVAGEIIKKKDFHLTEQEQQVLTFLAQGLSNKEIAEHLHTNEKRIKNVIAALLAKMSAKNRAHAVVIAIKYGIVSPADIDS